MKTFGLALRQGLQRTIYPLSATTTIGRAPDNTITVVHPTISRKHARLSLEGGIWVLEDLGSVNGIVFGGRRFDKLPLSPGDPFELGEVEFYFFDMEVSQGKTQFFETMEILLAAVEEDADHPGRGGTVQRLQRMQDTMVRVPFLSSLEEDRCRQLVENAAFHVFDEGELIIRQGDPGGSIYAVLDGKVRVFTRDDGDDELELATLGPSEFFGEMSLLSGELRSKSVAALETTVLAELSLSIMRKLMREHPDVANKLIDHHNRRLQHQEKILAKKKVKLAAKRDG
jgi:CRP-like cAMP-binding protein